MIDLNFAVFSDFENIAIGARDAHFDEFDIKLIMDRLLDKGRILHKIAYADWVRYASHRRGMHEEGFTLVEVPHVRYSGKNSADIQLVVDALDLCYTRPHISAFAILSGDSDFSPLVRKLRQNNKLVIGVGVKNSTSDLLISDCDEFIYYDDLVRKEKKRGRGRGGRSRGGGGERSSRKTGENPPVETSSGTPGAASAAGAADSDADAKDKLGEPAKAVALVLETAEALFSERGSGIWGSMVKQTLRRKRPNFNESYYGFATFSALLERCQEEGLLNLTKDDRSGGYILVDFGPNA
jgi:uncharacterized LabA/DUF88 family protein